MNVKSFLAGRRGICPHCEARFEIPHESEIPKGAPRFRPSSPQHEAASAQAESSAPVGIASAEDESPAVELHTEPPDPIAEAPDAVWYVRPPSGGQFGPARGDAMRRWIEEGRVSGDSLVWREGWADWATAVDWFPELSVESQGAPEEAPDTSTALLQLSDKEDAIDRVRRRPAKRPAVDGKSIAILVTLGLLIVVLVGVLVVIVQQSG